MFEGVGVVLGDDGDGVAVAPGGGEGAAVAGDGGEAAAEGFSDGVVELFHPCLGLDGGLDADLGFSVFLCHVAVFFSRLVLFPGAVYGEVEVFGGLLQGVPAFFGGGAGGENDVVCGVCGAGGEEGGVDADLGNDCGVLFSGEAFLGFVVSADNEVGCFEYCFFVVGEGAKVFPYEYGEGGLRDLCELGNLVGDAAPEFVLEVYEVGVEVKDVLVGGGVEEKVGH